MSAGPETPGLPFIVVGVQQSERIGATGTLEDVMRVTAQTVTGSTFVEEIPIDAFADADFVASVLTARALQIEAVFSLGLTPPVSA